MTNANTITVTLTKDAQKGALLASEPAAEVQTYEVPQELLPRLLALPWAKIDAAGVAACTVPSIVSYSESELQRPIGSPVAVTSYGYGSTEGKAPVRPTDAAAAIDFAEGIMAALLTKVDEQRREWQARQATIEASERKHAAAWAALPMSERIANGRVLYAHPVSQRMLERYEPEAYAAAKKAADEQLAEAKAQAAADKQRREEEAAAAAEARKSAIAVWVAAHGTDNQRQRLERGLLPEDEVISAMRDAAFLPLSFERYASLRNHDVPCHEHEYPCEGTVSFDVELAEELSPAQWETLQRIEAEAKPFGGTVEPRLHTAVCDNQRCQPPADRASRLGARVTLVCGPFTFTREFAL